MKWLRSANVDECGRCGSDEAAHEWRCTGCGVQSVEFSTCGCGDCKMPRPTCSCRGSIGLFCPESKRTISQDEYGERLVMNDMWNAIALRSSAKAWVDIMRASVAWESAEAERLWKARS